jgi:nucleotide-binding universal stress UspA family protein
MAPSVGPVVVGTDFSDTSAIALAEARRLAALLGTSVEVVHVVEAGAADAGDAARARAWLSAAGVSRGDLLVRHGSAFVELARYAAEVLPTLVVVGSHGLSGYQPLAIGSTASRVSVHARCPVVLVSPRVPAAAEYGGQQGIMDTASRAGAAAGARDEPGDQ